MFKEHYNIPPQWFQQPPDSLLERVSAVIKARGCSTSTEQWNVPKNVATQGTGSFGDCAYLLSHMRSELDSYIPDSHHKKHNVFFYKNMLEDVGFEIIYCKERRIKDILPSDEVYINFFTSVCVLMAHVPAVKKEEFREDLFQEILKQNGRDSNGLPFHRGTIIELVVKKN
ncbi:hypothetical protein AVEN_201810-1 [Araneus ventricosus]|uniref:Uncharacterized protein n=1 Tax=Araneus ventricosus TaxID=182803 RepID=A0A4Y2MCZ1_ARAVE|nr:hypothetical protein AVEN_201810-1 [Araneus ventricosus]